MQKLACGDAAFHVWGVDAAKWQDRGMLPVDALGAMMSAAKAGLNVLLERGWSLESRRQTCHHAGGHRHGRVVERGDGPARRGPCGTDC